MKKQLIAASVFALAATGGAYAAGSASAQGDQRAAQGGAASSAAAPVVVKCDGGRSINMHSRIVSSPFIFAETAVNDQDRAVPGASLSANGPASGTDTVLVTFSAETQLTGGDANDWMGLELKLDGVNVPPFTAGADKLAITGVSSWNSNSVQFCAKLKPGAHRFQVYTNLHDSSPAHTLNGWLDDYTVSFQRFE
ncbi:hypothetical protein [Nocardioides speluncae]|uniref:hypothetical protein n=1 Tax=Nocardioides speluncae TaxID=2670337 RepID=UPI000D689324|nr:hypothetical protein [Nocardioides speluncae]